MNILVLCLEIFFAKVLEVSIGSVRTIFLVKQKGLLSSVFAFIEIIIWFYVARETLVKTELSIILILSYAGGYAVGTYIGGIISKKFINQLLTAIIITTSNNLNTSLKNNNFGFTTSTLSNNKSLYIVELKRKKLKILKEIINNNDKNAFMIINETLMTENGYIH